MRANRRNQEPGVATPRLLDYTEERDMREIVRYQDEMSGEVYETIEEATISEEKSRRLRDLFAFVKPKPDKRDDYPIQHDRAYWEQYKAALMTAIETYEPEIVQRIADLGYPLEAALELRGFIRIELNERADIRTYMHYLDWSRICPQCYREWGRWHQVPGCQHDGTWRDET